MDFRWEGILAIAWDRAGLADGGRLILLWVFQKGRALRQKAAILPKLCSFGILCYFSL